MTNGTRIAVVDGDARFRQRLMVILNAHGYEAIAFENAEALLRSQSFPTIDMVLLEWQLSGMSGHDALLEMKRQRAEVSVVFHTDRPLAGYEMLALRGGALDFIDKRRGLPIVLRRLDIIARSKTDPSAPPEETVQSGRLILKPGMSRAFWAGQDLGLTIGEYNVLQMLVANAGHGVTYRSLYDCLQSPGFIAGAKGTGYRPNVRSLIKRLRRKFVQQDPGFDQIVNHHGVGYSWRQRDEPEPSSPVE